MPSNYIEWTVILIDGNMPACVLNHNGERYMQV